MTLTVCVDCLELLVRGRISPWAHACEVTIRGEMSPWAHTCGGEHRRGRRRCSACEIEAQARARIEALGLPAGMRAWGPCVETQEWEPCAACGSERCGMRYAVTLRNREVQDEQE
jgi:hypothetical protein